MGRAGGGSRFKAGWPGVAGDRNLSKVIIMSKISFRFYKDHEVRAIWDEANSKWWFSVQDVVGAINDQNDHKKNRNYWKYLKTRLRKDGNELVSGH